MDDSLKIATDIINKHFAKVTDGDLVKVAKCVNCNTLFPQLVQDWTHHQRNKLASYCGSPQCRAAKQHQTYKRRRQKMLADRLKESLHEFP